MQTPVVSEVEPVRKDQESTALLRLFDSMELSRRRFTSDLKTRSAAQLAFQPTSSAWSMLGVVEHLILVEAALIDYGRKSLVRPPQAVTLRESFGAAMVRCVMRTGTKITAPAAVRDATSPVQTADLSALDFQWSATRAKLRQFISDVPADRLKRHVFSHPISGGMTLRLGLKFIQSHLDHHQIQINRLERAFANR